MFTLLKDCEIFYFISISEFSLKLQGFFSFMRFFWEQKKKKTFLFICQRQQNIKQVGEKLEGYIISALKLFSTLHSLCCFFFLKAKCIFEFRSRKIINMNSKSFQSGRVWDEALTGHKEGNVSIFLCHLSVQFSRSVVSDSNTVQIREKMKMSLCPERTLKFLKTSLYLVSLY